MTPTAEQINSGLCCQYCGEQTTLMTGQDLYKGNFSPSNGQMFRVCIPCEAWVGCHEGTTTAKGSVANAATRQARIEAHTIFDQLHETGLINKIWKKYLPNTTNRAKAYKWLASKMGIPVDQCHIGYFTEANCKVACAIITPFLKYEKYLTDSHESIINTHIKKLGNEINTNLISDGYHTFGELYEHRIELYIALCKMHQENGGSVWKSFRHSDGELAFGGGWFVLGIHKAPGNQITYHLPEKYWEDCWFATELPQAPEFDGHTSADVLERLRKL